MKKWLFLFLFFGAVQSGTGCRHITAPSAVKNTTDSSVDSLRTDTFDNAAAIRTLKEFYTAYLTEQVNSDLSDASTLRAEQIQHKYVTSALLAKIYDNEVVDCDPFVNAQDYCEDWLHTIWVTAANPAAHIFMVTLRRNDVQQKMTFQVVKEGANYKIGDILDDDNRSTVNTQNVNTGDESFVVSCGSGCAMRYTADSFRQKDTVSIEVRFHVEMFVDEVLADNYYENYVFIYSKENEIQEIKMAGGAENILETLPLDARLLFENFAAHLIKIKMQ